MLALTVPLFAVQFWRINNEGLHIHIAPPMLIIGIIVCIALCMGFFRILPATSRLPVFSASVFFLCHLLSMMRAGDLGLAIREVGKLGFGLACFWAIAASFPRHEEDLQRFWKTALLVSAGLYLILMYWHFFVFKSSYLSGNLDELSRIGRNQVAEYLVYITPFSFASFGERRSRLRSSLITIVFVAALVYGGSRAAILSVACAAGYGFWRLWVQGKLKFGRFIIVVLGIVLVVVLPFAAVLKYVPDIETARKFHYLVDPNTVSRDDKTDISPINSYHERGYRIRGGIAMFLDSPIYGVGLTNSNIILGTLTHNDYVSILAETGAIGFFSFLGILWAVKRRLFGRPWRLNRADHWTGFGFQMAFVAVLASLMFTNSYTTPFLWIFLGLCWAQGEIEAGPGKQSAQIDARRVES
jgi:O-antigen ligase